MTKVLAIECAGFKLSCAIIEDDKILYYKESEQTSGFPEILVPEIVSALKHTGLSFQNIDVVATSQGAGSFTGVRIALATALGISLATSVKTFAVSNFTAAAFMVKDTEKKQKQINTILSVLETRRTDYYIQAFDTSLNPLFPPTAMTFSDIKESDFMKEKIILAGDAASRLFAELDCTLPNVSLALNTIPNALIVAQYALLHHQKEVSPLIPLYVSPANVTHK